MNNTSEKVFRCYVEKRKGFDTAALLIQNELIETLGLRNISLRLFNRYDIQNISEDSLPDIISTVLSEPVSDVYYKEKLPVFPDETRLLYVEPLPGQFDMRADSCEQCVQMLLSGRRPIVKTAKVFAFIGITYSEYERVKSYIINPLENRIADSDKPNTLKNYEVRQTENIPEIDFSDIESPNTLSLAMSRDDLEMIREYFKSQNRKPTLTEIRVLDTYWSDHCRHTTFNTIIESVDIKDKRVQKAYELFLSVNDGKPTTLMNIATAAMRYFKKRGGLPMLDESEENNACTIKVGDNLLFFKNETHNHPTEIEPYGGASTCIGGAIRDPLSGRAYVYQAMRITGAGDPRKSLNQTLQGKIPQKKLTVTAAEGFSSYGNQIGIATGFVKELYHEGYVAKRLETGAVIGAASVSSVRRESPSAGDIVVLLGGRTGRDGIGGATGSSKTHGSDTVSECAAEVQKGNAPEERKLQRLFRNPDVTKLIKRCNDFGAGGAAVAIGELADGVEINLDNFPVKYEGLNGTELAISESQERMAVVISKKDLPALLNHAETENIETSVVAEATEQKRLVMTWRGQKIVDIDREFLNTNGAVRTAEVYLPMPNAGVNCASHNKTSNKPFAERLFDLAADLNFCSQKGLVERFDNSIGAGSVFMPFGGKYALTETQVMAALLPNCDSQTASVMAYGFDPYFTETDPFGGSVYAVVTSVAKLIAAGVTIDTIHLTLQEYFPRVNDDDERWGLPFSAMLGAFSAQMGLKIAAIGGKDSMSGSFTGSHGDINLDVPPTLISFAVGVSNATRLISPEFKKSGNPVYLLETPLNSENLPDYAALRTAWEKYAELCNSAKVLSAWACENGGVYGGIIKMALGNKIGFSGKTDNMLFERRFGSIIFEASEELDGFYMLGHTQEVSEINGVSLEKLCEQWESPLESVFPVIANLVDIDTKSTPTLAAQCGGVEITEKITFRKRGAPYSGAAVTDLAKPKAVIPVFPGTNCEYDTAAAIERAGGISEIVLVRNLTPQMLLESVTALEKAIASAQMIIFPGGFSGGDEPDGSGKFIVSLFRNERLVSAVHELIKNRDGLILGICNGFQALVKLGLLPYGEITPLTEVSPTLAFNRIGRHQSRYVRTRIAGVLSPWLSKCVPDDIYVQPISHGEGRFTAPDEVLEKLKSNGQIAFQYVDYSGNPSMDTAHNPNGSVWAIEGICSPDGRILGKMAHTERYNDYTGKNISGNKFLPVFESGVNYFK
ncbi:MAG: phosphoribosylformylglycinamidine synthase [Oscillospiraceae bacterium]|nr:phosphoribosylformylglycinamidine synthase [Oscillospiraceae bacterium]